MKKALVLLLLLAMLVPMVLVMPATAAVEKQPFYALGWSDFDEKTYPYLYGLVETRFSPIGGSARMGNMIYGQYTDKEVTEVAQGIKTEMDKRPAGTRYWHVFGPTSILRPLAEDVVYLDEGVEQMKDMFTAILKKLKEMKCPLDGVVIDTEYFGMGAWNLYANTEHNDNNYQTNKNIYADIVKDKRYKTQIRPLLEEYGFPFWPNPAGEKSEIYTICYLNKGEQIELAKSIWNTVLRVHLNNYANQWCYEPLKEYYPNASLSDYQSHDSKSWMKLYGIDDDGVALSGGNSIKVGTASCFSYYYARPGSTFFNEHKQYASFNDAVYEASAFNGLLYDVNFTRHMLSSTDTKQIAPWITSYLYGGKKASSMAYTPYYTELLYHLGMFDPEPFLSYTYVNEYAEEGQAASYTAPKYLKTQQVMNEIMKALSDVAGYSDRKPIELPQYWNAEYVVSGMYANGRNIWRITPNTDEISLQGFMLKSVDPTFRVKGQTITFPGGKILKDATISEVGSCGYWVETKAGVNPVMTAEKDRYANYPSYVEDFNSYANGTLNIDKMRESYAWNYGGAANIVTSGSGKALSLTGGARIQNITIPAKITAGDSYAKNQTWELTVNIPSGLSADAEICLLQYTGANSSKIDGAIKIQDGKVSYGEFIDNATAYRHLTDITPGTYTIKRVLDFEKFTYSVYLLDAKGKTLASAENAKCPSFTTTISAISFFTKKADKAVLFDDYKLYPCGVTTDFELYDAATGTNIKGKDAEKARSRSTAYRLSWLNGSDAEKTVTVVAAIYENGNLKAEKAVKTLTMKPGCDGVETGVVEIKAGQSVKVYLDDGSQSNGDSSKPDTAETTPVATEETEDTSATKATKVTKPKLTKPTRASKATKATKAPTKATQPGATVEPNATEDAGETLMTEAVDETLSPVDTQATAATVSGDSPDEPKGKNTIVVVAIIAVVLAVAGVVTWLCLQKKKQKKTEE